MKQPKGLPGKAPDTKGHVAPAPAKPGPGRPKKGQVRASKAPIGRVY